MFDSVTVVNAAASATAITTGAVRPPLFAVPVRSLIGATPPLVSR